MKRKIKIIQSTILILLISLFYIFFVEIITRISISLIEKNKNYLFYGFNKDFVFEIVDLSDLKFNYSNLNQINIKNSIKIKKNENDKKKIIWVFGASLTYGYACGKDSSSWPIELNKLNSDITIINYGFPSIYSDDSIKILIHELNNNKSKNPDYIFWAHRDEEILSSVRGIDRNKEKIKVKVKSNLKQKNFYILRIGKTFEKNFLSFEILRHIINKLNKKYNFDVKDKLTEKDFLISSQNFELNTIDAIKISKIYDIKKFYLISLLSDDQFMEDDNKKNFRFFYKKIVNNLLKDNQNIIEFIDLFNLIPENIKNNNKNFFCENKHYTLMGNQVISQIINKKIFGH